MVWGREEKGAEASCVSVLALVLVNPDLFKMHNEILHCREDDNPHYLCFSKPRPKPYALLPITLVKP